MLDPTTVQLLKQMDREGGVRPFDSHTASRMVRCRMAERRDDLLWITDYGLERLERHEAETCVQRRVPDGSRWRCLGRRVRDYLLYSCVDCGKTRFLRPNNTWIAACPGCADRTHPAVAGVVIGGFRTTGVVDRKKRRSEDRYEFECLKCGAKGGKTMQEARRRTSGCRSCAQTKRGGKPINMTGETHGHWLVLGRHDRGSEHRVRCTVCGGERLHHAPKIRCVTPCLRCAQIKDREEYSQGLIGKDLGVWTAIRAVGDRRDGREQWLFRCKSGHERVASPRQVGGETRCAQCIKDVAPKVGDRHKGREVVEILPGSMVALQCLKCDTRTTTSSHNARRGGCKVCHMEQARRKRK